MKKCTKCQNLKELSDFYNKKHENGKIYKSSRCKKCLNEQRTLYNQNYRSVRKDKVKTWSKSARLKQMQDPVKHERMKLLKRENSRKNYLQVLWKRTSDRAKRNNIEFSITKEDVIIPLRCPILGIPLFLGTKGDYKNSPSIDRVNNSKGYTKDNIRVISSLANTMKNCATEEQLLEFSKNILNYIVNNDIVRPVENIESTELEDKEPLG